MRADAAATAERDRAVIEQRRLEAAILTERERVEESVKGPPPLLRNSVFGLLQKQKRSALPPPQLPRRSDSRRLLTQSERGPPLPPQPRSSALPPSPLPPQMLIGIAPLPLSKRSSVVFR